MVIDEIRKLDCDIICLQEVDNYKNFYQKELNALGYETVFFERPTKSDGCLTGYKRDRFFLQPHSTILIDYNSVASKLLDPQEKKKHTSNNIGVLMILEPLCEEGPPILISNTHLYWNPKHPSVREKQLIYLLYHSSKLLDKCKSNGREPAFLVCGDLNTNRDSKAYKYLVGSTEETHKRWKHQLSLSDAYEQLELPFTMYFEAVKMVSDYIFHSNDLLQCEAVLEVEESEQMYPNASHPSDHVPLSAIFSFKRNEEK